jgi:dTDP-4-dehydrorhamnose reductase
MKVLITGGAGLLAGHLIETASPQHELVVAWHQQQPQCGTCTLVRGDIAQDGVFSSWVAEHRPDIVIHAAGIGSVDFCQQHPAQGRRANVEATANVIAACRAAGARLVYVSTNAVYRGDRPPYGEDRPQQPVNEYGRLKMECERIVRNSGLQWAIVRPILMYGWSRPWGRKDTVVWMLESLGRGSPINLVNDVRENPLAAEDCASAIWAITARGLEGEFNIAGSDVVNRHQLGLAAADVFGCDRSLVHEVDSSFFPALAPRPHNTSFDTAKMETVLGLRPRGLREGLQRMRDTRPRSPDLLVKGRLLDR